MTNITPNSWVFSNKILGTKFGSITLSNQVWTKLNRNYCGSKSLLLGRWSRSSIKIIWLMTKSKDWINFQKLAKAARWQMMFELLEIKCSDWALMRFDLNNDGNFQLWNCYDHIMINRHSWAPVISCRLCCKNSYHDLRFIYTFLGKVWCVSRL